MVEVNNALSDKSLQLVIVTKILHKVKKIYNSVNQAKCAQSRDYAQFARILCPITRNTFISWYFRLMTWDCHTMWSFRNVRNIHSLGSFQNFHAWTRIERKHFIHHL